MNINLMDQTMHILLYTLKHCADEIAPILYVIFNQSLSTSLLPDDWLKANNRCPVYKKGIITVIIGYQLLTYIINLHLPVPR